MRKCIVKPLDSGLRRNDEGVKTRPLVVIPSFLQQADQNDDNASNQQFVIPAKAGIQEDGAGPAGVMYWKIIAKVEPALTIRLQFFSFGFYTHIRVRIHFIFYSMTERK